jgi:hypothetical protein
LGTPARAKRLPATPMPSTLLTLAQAKRRARPPPFEKPTTKRRLLKS